MSCRRRPISTIGSSHATSGLPASSCRQPSATGNPAQHGAQGARRVRPHRGLVLHRGDTGYEGPFVTVRRSDGGVRTLAGTGTARFRSTPSRPGRAHSVTSSRRSTSARTGRRTAIDTNKVSYLNFDEITLAQLRRQEPGARADRYGARHPQGRRRRHLTALRLTDDPLQLPVAHRHRRLVAGRC